jgi:serine protease Do
MISNSWKTALIAVATSVATIAGYKAISGYQNDVIINEAGSNKAGTSLVNYNDMPVGQPGDFTYAAGVSAPAVVHIKAKSIRTVRQMPSIFDQFFGMDDEFGGSRNQKQESSGSGVIISEDGYIVTNNHVVEGATELEVVTYDKKIYEAKVIGVDPSTDIAVIKVEAAKLPSIVFANSDDVKVGEWVLAVGNPFNLESTVTAGIISAMSRSINILKNKDQSNTNAPIESFIQTDAAVNPGNSGGALVNLNGQLIGINTAIASPNGAYAGYSFAVPSTIVKKVSTDLIKFGNVQRGFLGINPVELSRDAKKELKLDTDLESGIYVYGVPEDGAAAAAGIKKGDVITKVDGIAITSMPKFLELIGRKRPGDKADITLNRNGSVKDISVVLRNSEGGKGVLKVAPKNNSAYGKLGLKIEELSAKEKEKIGLRNGVRITGIDPTGTFAQENDGIEEGFIITRVGNAKVNSVKEVQEVIETAKKQGEEGVLMCGVYEGYSKNYCFGVTIQ